jgi:hypothetical protein
MAVAADSHRDFLIPARARGRTRQRMQKHSDASRLFLCAFIIARAASFCKRVGEKTFFSKTTLQISHGGV